MSSAIASREQIQVALNAFSGASLPKASTQLLKALGYTSSKTADFGSKPEQFISAVEEATHSTFNRDKAHVSRWQQCAFLFQLTNDEIPSLAAGQQAFSTDTKLARSLIESFVFLAIELQGENWSRTDLAAIARELNRRFPMPAIVIFKHGELLSLVVIDRRANLKDAAKDVIDSRITVIKDVRIAAPHRAHLDILGALALENLGEKRRPANFRELYDAWIAALSTQALNKRFYQELANWYFWALTQAEFPKDAPKDADGRDSLSLIRLITRIIFCWFLKEKGLLPDALFDPRKIATLLGDYNPAESNFYKAILQNLFFATLNQEMDKREFRKAGQNFMAHNLYRYRSLMKNPDEVLKLIAGIPFMNGGLFECLDKTLGTREKPTYVRIDGFSDRDDNPLKIPNELFFGEERIVDLSEAYGDNKFKSAKATGLIHILDRYKFTVAENTPIEEEVALDPELLGKVFENLLAAYNPETGATARKQTGSFYTPREIVNYMVDESLIASLKTKLEASPVGRVSPSGRNPTCSAPTHDDVGLRDEAANPTYNTEQRLRHLFAYNDQPHLFSAAEVEALIEAIDHLKILDPACGSGAFPMGILHKLVFVLGKLDPGNQFWKARQLAKASEIPDATVRERVMDDIEQTFGANELDYGRKLYLIENCIYGVDIQPIAVQISKLRFFISLVVEQKVNSQADNLGIRPLPNLETKFVAANTLIGINRPGQQLLRNLDIDVKEAELRRVRERHFLARTPTTKAKCREQDATLRVEIAELLKSDGWNTATACALADWNPYDQNASADFFDLEWMFGMLEGFDVAIGNPPFVRADEPSDENKRLRERILASRQYETLWEKWDLFVPFIEKGFKLLRSGGITTMIVSDAYCHSKYAQKSQSWFLKNSRILRLDFCADLKIFDAAVHNVIYFFQCADGAHHTPERRVHRETFGNVTTLPSDEQERLTYRAFFPEETQHAGFFAPTFPIGSICYVSFGCRPNSDEKRAKGLFVAADLVSESRDKEHPKRYIEAKDIQRWTYQQSRWLEWGTERSPSMLARATFEELYEVAEKIVAADVSGAENRAAYDASQAYHSHTLISFVPWHALAGVRNNSLKKTARYRGEAPPRPDLPKREELESTSRRFAVKYLLGVMNSSSARDFLRANRRSNIHLYPDDWKNLPIPDVSPQQQQPLVALVEQILAAKRANTKADITALEAELDHAVALLYYGTTP